MAEQSYSHAHERNGRRCEIVIRWSAPDESPELWWENGCDEAERLLGDTWRRTIEIVSLLDGKSPTKFQAPDTGHSEGQSIATEPEPGSAAAPPTPERHESWPNSYNPNNTRQLG